MNLEISDEFISNEKTRICPHNKTKIEYTRELLNKSQLSRKDQEFKKDFEQIEIKKFKRKRIY